jgi:DNA-directed RNA polymerase subunit RPC12/RpoP
MSTEPVKTVTDDGAVTASDIVFDCPACGKSLVVDEAAEGMIVDCPQCRTNVIVPPKSTKPVASAPPPSPKKEEPKASQPSKPAPFEATEDSLQQRLSVLSGQLKEIQAQRTEVTGRIATRLNDVNRDLVIIARLETSQQQILSEWNQLVEKIAAGRAVVELEEAQPAVIGASVNRAGRTRVSFRQ